VVARKFDNIKRYCWMNLIETKRVGTDERPGRGSSHALGTIEVRSLGNTAKFEYVWAWTNLLLKLAAYVAYLPSSLAILRCGMINSFEEDFSLLGKYKAEVVETPMPMLEPSRVVSPSFRPPDQRLTGTPHPRRGDRTFIRRPRPATPIEASEMLDDGAPAMDQSPSPGRSNANILAEREARAREAIRGMTRLSEREARRRDAAITGPMVPQAPLQSDEDHDVGADGLPL